MEWSMLAEKMQGFDQEMKKMRTQTQGMVSYDEYRQIETQGREMQEKYEREVAQRNDDWVVMEQNTQRMMAEVQAQANVISKLKSDYWDKDT